MNLAEKAFVELFPKKKLTRELKVKYSRAFNPYNANVRYTANSMIFRLAYEWKKVSPEIKMGLIQSLLLKIHKEKKKTIHIDLYENFIKNVGDYSEIKESDPVLEQSFVRVNEKYFNGFIDKPNLKWGNASFSKLGGYEYGSNTVTISRVLAEDKELLDYVMYHELLHKKYKFQTKNGRSYHHTPKFRKKEKEFDNPDIEKYLERFLRKKKIKSIFKSKEEKSKKRKGFWWF